MPETEWHDDAEEKFNPGRGRRQFRGWDYWKRIKRTFYTDEHKTAVSCTKKLAECKGCGDVRSQTLQYMMGHSMECTQLLAHQQEDCRQLHSAIVSKKRQRSDDLAAAAQQRQRRRLNLPNPDGPNLQNAQPVVAHPPSSAIEMPDMIGTNPIIGTLYDDMMRFPRFEVPQKVYTRDLPASVRACSISFMLFGVF